MAGRIRYTTGIIPSEPEAVPQALYNELNKIRLVLDAIVEALPIEERNAAPDKYYNGMLVRADGTNWNPGSGQGVYCYYNSAWNYLG